ncbi:MAG: transporter permease [Betaproteobacteria bacterium]|nr:transporter permease [Betaproteobacteria bacterium]
MIESDPQARPAPDVRLVTASGHARCLMVGGAWNLRGLESRLPELNQKLADFTTDSGAKWDLSEVDVLDHAGAMVLWRAWGRRRTPHLTLKPEHEAIFRHLAMAAPATAATGSRDPLRLILGVGDVVLNLIHHLIEITVVLGQVVIDAMHLVRHPKGIPWREISSNVYRTGTQALGITALVGFLVGVVLSYLSAQQLRIFGADAFIVNILGISVVRELGPVLAAILIAGRSGSAITAQLGVMRVTQELDAMAVMGIPRTLRLILPKMIALAISMPLIVLWTNAIALMGGMTSAQFELGIGYGYFISSLPDAVPIANLWLGLGKGVVFGFLIALVACHFGLLIEPNTESLGIGTTSSVVTSITVVIIVDAIFAIMFKDIGIS